MAGRLSIEQLRGLVDYDRMRRVFAEVSIDLFELSQFYWLVVSEEVLNEVA
jgi:hypothetical protein